MTEERFETYAVIIACAVIIAAGIAVHALHLLHI